MAKQVINIGNQPNDGSGENLRSAFDKCNDNFTEVYDDIQTLQGSQVTASSLIRADYSVSANGGNGQDIAFSSQFVTNYSLVIIDFNGLGVEVVSKDEDGFTINSLTSGTFGYFAGIEV